MKINISPAIMPDGTKYYNQEEPQETFVTVSEKLGTLIGGTSKYARGDSIAVPLEWNRTNQVIKIYLNEKNYIENRPEVINIIKSLPEVESISPRYRLGGSLEANYQTRKDTDKKKYIQEANRSVAA